MGNAEKSVRTRDPAAKLSAIIASAEKLFSEQGFERTKMQDIAEHANVAVGTLYRSYPDKASLLAALHRQIEDDFIRAMEDGWSKGFSYPERFDCLVEGLLDELVRGQKRMPLYMMTRNIVGVAEHRPGERVMKAIDGLYREAVKAKAARPFPPGYQPAIGHAIIEGAFRAWMADPTPMHRVQVERETQKLLRRAFEITDPERSASYDSG